MKINKNTKWGKASKSKKRIEGFLIYQVCSFFALFIPEAVDYALLKELRKQFDEAYGDDRCISLEKGLRKVPK